MIVNQEYPAINARARSSAASAPPLRGDDRRCHDDPIYPNRVKDMAIDGLTREVEVQFLTKRPIVGRGNLAVTATFRSSSTLFADRSNASRDCTRVHLRALPSITNCAENGVPEGLAMQRDFSTIAPAPTVVAAFDRKRHFGVSRTEICGCRKNRREISSAVERPFARESLTGLEILSDAIAPLRWRLHARQKAFASLLRLARRRHVIDVLSLGLVERQMLNFVQGAEVNFREIDLPHTAIVLSVIIKHFIVGVGRAGPDG
jgi:hypothetical protein